MVVFVVAAEFGLGVNLDVGEDCVVVFVVVNDFALGKSLGATLHCVVVVVPVFAVARACVRLRGVIEDANFEYDAVVVAASSVGSGNVLGVD